MIMQSLAQVASGGALNTRPWELFVAIGQGNLALLPRFVPWQVPPTSLPVTWLAYLPFHAAGLDLRLANLLAELGSGLVLVTVATGLRTAPTVPWRVALATVWRNEPVLLLWAWVFLLPSSLHWSLTTVAPVPLAVMSLLLATLVLNRPWASALLLGLASAASVLTFIAAPLVLCHWLRWRGWRATALFTCIAALAAGACLLPFLGYLPFHVVGSYWTWVDGSSIYPHRYWARPATWVELVGFSRAFWAAGLGSFLQPIAIPGGPLVAAIQLLTGGYLAPVGTLRLPFNLPQLFLSSSLVLLCWQRGATVRVVLLLLPPALLLYLLFHPFLGPYIYNPALLSALFAAVVYRAVQPTIQPVRQFSASSVVSRVVLAGMVLPLLLGTSLLLIRTFTSPVPQREPTPFGIVARLGARVRSEDHPATVALMREAGVQWQREELTWATIQRQRGSVLIWGAFPGYGDGFYDYDEAIGVQQAAGINMVGLLSYHPAWFYHQAAPPLDTWIDDWGAFVYATVSRYGHARGWIKHWELWNEPNLAFYGADLGITNAQDFARLLAVGRAAARAADPEAQIVLGGLASVWDPAATGPNTDYRTYLEQVMQAGGWQHIDILAVHPYRPAAPEAGLQRGGQREDLRMELRQLDQLMAAYGARPVWITELGWPTHAGWPYIDEQTQAFYLVRAYVLALTHPGVEKVFWYELRNSTAINVPYQQPILDTHEEQFHYGLLRRSYPLDPQQPDMRKPAFIAYRTLVHMLTGLTLQQVVADNTTPETAGVYWYRFGTPAHAAPSPGAGRFADVFWRTGEVWPTFAAAYPCPQVDVWQWDGSQAATYTTANGQVMLPAPEVGAPMYATCATEEPGE